MRQGSKAMEQHGTKLDHQDQRKEEHEHQTDRFQLEVLFRDVHLDGWFESRVDELMFMKVKLNHDSWLVVTV